MKKFVVALMALCLVGASAFGAMLKKGTRELGVAGNIDRDSAAGEVAFGYFVMDGLILGAGVGGEYNDLGDDSDLRSYSGKVFAQYHLDLGSPIVPFVGAGAGAAYSKIKIKDVGSDSETASIGEGQLGVKAFIAENIAIAVYGFVDVSNKEIFSNKDEMEKKDWGVRVGMNSYF